MGIGPSKPYDNAESAILITVPEDFLSFAIGELTSRHGYVRGIEKRGELGIIDAFLPASQFNALSEVIMSATLKRGWVEHA